MDKEKKTHFMRAGYGWLIVAIVVLLGSYVAKEYKQRKFDPEAGMNIVIVGEKQIGIMAIRKEEDLSSFVVLPEKLVVDIEDSGSKLRIGSLWGLGKLEGQPGKLVMRNIGRALALGVSGYVKVSSDDLLDPAKLTRILLQPNTRTNISWWDRFSLRQNIKAALARGEMNTTKISESIYLAQVDPDGVENYVIDKQKLGMWAQRAWMTPDVLGERVNVAVFNNSDREGKARELAEALEVSGARVIEIAKGGSKTDGCEYILNRKDLTKTPIILEKQYGCKLGKFAPLMGEGRADIEIVTGDN